MPTVMEQIQRAQESLGAIDREAGGTVQAEQFADSNNVRYGYWRKPDGWLTFGQLGANAIDRFYRGWMVVQGYGTFDPPRDASASGPIGDPFLHLIEHNGAKELPADQVLSLGWHRPPGPTAKRSHRLVWERVQAFERTGLDQRVALQAVFPTLADVDWVDLDCSLCPGRWFNGRTQDEAASLRHKHELIVHVEDARTRELRDSITQALGSSGSNDSPKMQPEVLEALVLVLSQQGEAIKELLAAAAETKSKK